MCRDKKVFFIGSLSSKITVVLSITLLIMLLILSIFIINIINTLLIDSARSKGLDLTRMFAEINSLPMERLDYYSLEQNVIELQKNKDILFAQVFDTDMFLITPSSNLYKPLDSSMVLVYEEDIKNDNGIVTGHVIVGFDTSYIQSLIKRYAAILLVYSFLIILIAFLILLFLINLVVNKPLRLLLNSVNRISLGDIEHKAEIRSNDEIGNLAENFNIMTSKLKSSISTLNCIVESMPSVLISVDRDHNVIEWNNMASKLTGVDKNEAFSKNLYGITDLFSGYRDIIDDVLETEKSEKLLRVKIRENDEHIYDISFFPLRNVNVEGVVFRIDDMTENEKRENQLIQAQKMESIGNLAGGLAHNLNNILAGIVGTTTFLEYKLQTNQDISNKMLDSKLKIIDEAGQRASELIKELMSISGKPKHINYQIYDLSVLLENVIKICDNTFDKSVDIKTEFNEGEALFYGNDNQIEQVLLNICINACHSMTIMRKEDERRGGSLGILLKRFRADRYFSDTHADSSLKDFWLVEISDTGVGMDKETLKKIFDPFFTTKKEHMGTGLGLSMVFNIITQHKGFIDVYSEPERGSGFKIYIPVFESREESKKSLKESLKNQCILKGEGSILIVDDDENVCNISKEMLKECGYTVYTASNGIEGLEVIRNKRKEILLVILDMIMPKKSGIEVMEEIRAIAGEIKVVLSSGFIHENDDEKALKEKADGFLSKPFTITDLSETIYSLLHNHNKRED